MKKTVQNFFVNLHRNEGTKFRCMRFEDGRREVEDVIGKYEDVQSQLHLLNGKNYEIYFLVNTGGFKADDINKINAVFIDLDCGRAQDGNYYSKDITTEFKYESTIKLHQFEYEPTYVIETRNGLHAYWFLEEGATVEEFMECQEKLIQHFNADPVVKNSNRLLRVPETYWCKDPTNKYLAKIHEDNNTRYNIKDIIKSLPTIKDREFDTPNKKYSILLPIRGIKTSPVQNNIQLIQDRDIAALQRIVNPIPLKVSNNIEVYDYLKRQDMRQLLGLHGKSFRCIFHDDNNPSAGILVNKTNGHYIYNCLSASCNVSFNIIQVIERLTSMSISDSLNFLRAIYKIEHTSSEWKERRISILDKNVETFLSSELPKELDKFVGRYSEILLFLHCFNKQKVISEKNTDWSGNPLFFISMNHLASQLDKDAKTVRQKINILTYLGLLRKIPKEEIPMDLLRKSQEYAREKKHQKLITYYSIPEYNENTIHFAERKAREYKEMSFSVNGFSRELIFRALGEKEANRIFPQDKGKKLSSVSNDNASKIEEILLSQISEKGWTMEQEVISILDQTSGPKGYSVRMFKRVLPEVLEKYMLKKQRLNKELKKELQVPAEGYPMIIIKE
ncbi:hypothetical protein [Sutcliffiella horikoshii]|uniref:hypothetical protein n=1 Tax=Sutcliffiella horikoshii TaxID=79883 RepID=UPI001CFEB529|nr:hypothetical protein [Sutcliffiella horikoshii]